jgi:hypothetical protein
LKYCNPFAAQIALYFRWEKKSKRCFQDALYLKDYNGKQRHSCALDFISTLQQIVIYSVIPCCYLPRYIWQFFVAIFYICLHYCSLLRYILPLIFAVCGITSMFCHSLFAIIYFAIRCYFVLRYIVAFINFGTIISYLSNQYRLYGPNNTTLWMPHSVYFAKTHSARLIRPLSASPTST